MYDNFIWQMNFHGSNRESLFSVFDKDMVPEELGGTLPSIDKLTEANFLFSYSTF